jgi:hypothetical protein
MNITAAKRADPGRNGKGEAKSYRGGALLLSAFALIAFVSGAPRLIGGLHALTAREAVSAALEGAVPPVAVLETAAAELAAAERWSGVAEYKLDRGLLLLRQASMAADPQEQAALFTAAEDATVAGLATAPGEPGAWTRLAWLRRRRGDVDGALAALRLSWLSGSFTPALMNSRLEFALSLQAAMDEEMLSLLRRQIRLVWVTSPDFVTMLATRPSVGALVSEALAELSEQDLSRYLELHGAKR